MDKTPKIVLLLAGGVGNRVRCNPPKQFLEIAGKPVVAYPMLAFERHPEIEGIYVVCSPEWWGFVDSLADEENIGKFRRCFPSGELSVDSMRNGLKGIREDFPDEDPVVILHESARPLITADIITGNLRVFEAHGNAITAIQSHEAYMESGDGVKSVAGIPREKLYRAQTPQTFRLSEMESAFAKAEAMHLPASQSLYTLMRETNPGKELYIAPGNDLNFKLTHPQDVEVMKAILEWGRV